jgi:hypothetical protein
MQSARRIVSVLELLKVARHADCRTLPRAVKIQKGLERLADSGTAAARVLQSCTCPSSCVSALPPSAQHTLPDVGAMASAAFCSTAAVCQGPRQHHWAGFQKQPKAALLCFFHPCPARRFPRFWCHPPRAPGEKPPLVVLQGTFQWCHTPPSPPTP